MRVAIYARYSTDKQREASVDDQFRNCEHHAEREGLLEGIKTKLLMPEAEQRFVWAAARRLSDRRCSCDLETVRQRLAEVEREIANIMTAIKAGILTPTTKAELQAAEAKREQLRLQTDRNGNGKVAELLPQATAKLRQMVENLERTAGRDVAFVRAGSRSCYGAG